MTGVNARANDVQRECESKSKSKSRERVVERAWRRRVVTSLALASPFATRLARARANELNEQLAIARAPTNGNAKRTTSVALKLDETGTYVSEFRIGRARVRAVVDTGSPFATTMEGNGMFGVVDERDFELVAFEETREMYGLQVDGATSWVVANEVEVGGFAFADVVVGVAAEVENRGGSARGLAPFPGLCKQRASWIRPSFLEQTDVVSFELDFERELLTLSRISMIDEYERGTMRAVDLRPYGAPVFHYAVPCDSLWINGEPYASSKPIYCVFDSGTTGMLVSRQLYDDSDFSIGTQECHMWFTDTSGEDLVVGSSLWACKQSCLFIVSPIDVPWPGVENGDFHVVFVGMAALRNQGSMTVDADRGLVRFGRFGVA